MYDDRRFLKQHRRPWKDGQRFYFTMKNISRKIQFMLNIQRLVGWSRRLASYLRCLLTQCLANATWKAVEGDPSPWAPTTDMKDLEEAPCSWLCSLPTLFLQPLGSDSADGISLSLPLIFSSCLLPSVSEAPAHKSINNTLTKRKDVHILYHGIWFGFWGQAPQTRVPSKQVPGGNHDGSSNCVPATHMRDLAWVPSSWLQT